MTKFDSNIERDMNRCAVALEKLTKLVTLQQEVIELMAAKEIPKPPLDDWEIRELEAVRARMEAKERAKETAKARRRKKNET